MNDSLEEECLSPMTPNLEIKFAMLVLATPVICVFGVIGNILTIIAYSKAEMRCSVNWYLVGIACADILILGTACTIYPVEVFMEYYEVEAVSRAWHFYINYVYTLSNMGPLTSVYLTMSATLERWVAMRYPDHYEKLCGGRKTLGVILGVIVLALGLNLGKFWEFKAIEKSNCTGLARYYLVLTWESENSAAFRFYSIWLSNFVTCVLPFFFLLIMNTLIVTASVPKLVNRHDQTILLPMRPFVSRHSRWVRQNRRKRGNKIIVIVVFAFLTFNFPGVVLSIIEYGNSAVLEAHPAFYSFYKDAINMLVMISSATNFVIYVIYDRRFRRALTAQLCFRYERIPKCHCDGLDHMGNPRHL